jgi:hypothetical protein
MSRQLILAAVAVLILAVPVRADAPKREAFEVAVDNALAYLANAQNDDGSWNSGTFNMAGRGVGMRDPAITALCVMAYLSAGHVPGEGRYGDRILRGIRYVCSQQQGNGVFAAQQFGMTVMYSHGICTLMVAEVIGLIPDRREASELRKRLVAAVRLIASAQSGKQGMGGWRYSIQPNDADMSVTAWQVMALRAAKNVGCDVPTSIVDRAVEYIKNSNDRNTGGYRYTMYGGQVTVACTGAAILSLELSGKEYHKSEESLTAAQYITDQLVRQGGAGRGGPVNFRLPHFFYGVYYTAQAMFQIGGKYWDWYRQYLHALLLNPDAHAQRPGGFWVGVSPDDQQAGVNYCTAMAVLALTVEYRFLPIYQRGEEPDERGDK